jgi:uncharacterized protein (DUF302 family)
MVVAALLLLRLARRLVALGDLASLSAEQPHRSTHMAFASAVGLESTGAHLRRDACRRYLLNGKDMTMSYTIDRKISDADFDAVEERVRAALAERGFGVLTEIDVKATMKKKIDVEMAPYRILGACNPQMAWKAIGMEPRVGAMLPCNVILRQVGDGIEISAIDPVASMQSIDNDDLKAVAAEVRDMLAEAVRAA